MPQRYVILGPTASGKSETAAILAEKLQTFVVSVDARQCYKYLNIGTAKPDDALLRRVHHEYISVLEPHETETAFQFRRRCDAWESGLKPGQPVVYAGGSTLYLQSLLFDLDEIPPSNPGNLKALEEQEKAGGLESLFERLKQADPEYAQRMDGLNRQRIFRALDVWMQTGRPFSSFHSRTDFERPREGFRVFGIDVPRDVLHGRINRRVDGMMKSGLVDEVRDLIGKYDRELQCLQTVGYREVISFLDGEIPESQMIEDIKTNTRRYARRQLTWFRRWPFIQWIPSDGLSPEEIADRVFSETGKHGDAKG